MRRFAAVLMLILWSSAALGQVAWKSSLQVAKQASAVTGKPVLLLFHASWCQPCREMEEQTFRDPRVVKQLEGLICVKLDIDREEAAARTYGVNSIPRILLLSAQDSRPVMDVLGYRDADQFTGEMDEALHPKAGGAAPVPQENTDLVEVRRALGTHTFKALERSNPKRAAEGFKQLIQQLGTLPEQEFSPILALIRGAGNSAVPALLAGMADRYLVVRSGAYRGLQTIARERHLAPTPRFDPWASASERKRELKLWTKWQQSRRPAS